MVEPAVDDHNVAWAGGAPQEGYEPRQHLVEVVLTYEHEARVVAQVKVPPATCTTSDFAPAGARVLVAFRQCVQGLAGRLVIVLSGAPLVRQAMTSEFMMLR